MVLSLVYYNCPMLCTEVLNGMKGVFRHLPLVVGRDFEVVTVSIDPTETPSLAAAKKEKYLEGYEHPEGASGWHFLTGDEQQIRTLADVVGFRYVYDKETRQYAHAAGIMVLTPGGTGGALPLRRRLPDQGHAACARRGIPQHDRLPDRPGAAPLLPL